MFVANKLKIYGLPIKMGLWVNRNKSTYLIKHQLLRPITFVHDNIMTLQREKIQAK